MLALIKELIQHGPAGPSGNYGLLAEFTTPRELYHACERVRDAGYQKWDAHTPFPVHGLEKAMGIPASPLGWIVLGCAMIGVATGFLGQWWVSEGAYPLVISGKPFFSWPAFIPVTFETGVLLGAFGAVFGMFALNQLPQLYHSLFRSERFERVTDDRFFISIESLDPNYDEEGTTRLLKEAGATHVEVVER